MSRERWNSRTIFILAAIGSAVGLGNAWRFPGQAFMNGGGAFLIPYFVALVTAGIPLLILEHAIGRKYQSGAPIALKRVNGKAEPLGWWALATSFVIVSYYCVVMAWVIDYIWYSLTVAWKDGPADFFIGKVLHLSEGPGVLGGFSVPVLIGLIIAWISVWFCIRNGVKSVGKVVLWTVPIPVVLLAVLVVRAITLPGAAEGLAYYLTPDWAALLKPGVWAAAYGQVFFSLSILFGIMIAYGSYLNKDSDLTTDGLIISFADAGISFLAGFAVFGTLGYLAGVTSTPIKDMKFQGVFLAFATYPEAINKLPGGTIVAVIFGLLFVLMLFTLAIDSAFSIVEGIVTGLVDKFGWNKNKTTVWTCVVGFLGSLIFATKAGLYWLDITDHWVNDFNLITIGIFECFVVGWIFGARKLREYFNKTSTVKFGVWWDIMIRFVTPIVLLYISVSYLIENIKNNYGGYESKYLIIGGWGVLVVTIIAGFVVSFFKGKETTDESEEEAGEEKVEAAIAEKEG